MKKHHWTGWKIFLFCVTCYAALFNLETSPFRYLVPSAPFSECLGNQLQGDTYVYLYIGNLIPQGLMPYRDSFDHKGPLLYLIMALGIALGRVAGVWFIQSCFLFVSAYFAYRTAHLLVSSPASALSAGLVVLWSACGETRPETLAIPFLLVSLDSFVRYLLHDCQISKRETFLTGICFGAVALLKINLTALWLVFIVAVIWVSVARKNFSGLFSRAAAFLLGTALLAVPVFLWLCQKGVFADFIAAYWQFNFNGYGREPSLKTYLLFFSPPVIAPHADFVKSWGNMICFWFNTPALVTYLLLAKREKSRDKKILFALMAVLLLIDVLVIGIKGTLYYYYCFPMAPVYLLFFACAFSAVLKLIGRRPLSAFLLFLFLSVPVLHTLLIPPLRERIFSRLLSPAESSPYPENVAPACSVERSDLDLAGWLKENTEEDATINGVDSGIYWYSGRRCASRYCLWWSRSSYEHTFVKDDRGRPPEFIFERRVADRAVKGEFHTSPEIEKTLAEDYDLVYQNKAYDLYRRRQ